MAIEQVLESLVKAVEANTAALLGKGSAPVGAVASLPPRVGTKGGETTTISLDQLKVAASAVMDKQGKPFVKKLIKDVGGADSLPGVKKEKFGALMKAFEKAIPADDADEDDDSTDDDDDL
jgi:hypothetical protein